MVVTRLDLIRAKGYIVLLALKRGLSNKARVAAVHAIRVKLS